MSLDDPEEMFAKEVRVLLPVSICKDARIDGKAAYSAHCSGINVEATGKTKQEALANLDLAIEEFELDHNDGVNPKYVVNPKFLK